LQRSRRLTQASLQLKKCSRSPLHSGCGISTSETAETAAAFSPEDVFRSAGHDAPYSGRHARRRN
jgi:hypothetical protein